MTELKKEELERQASEKLSLRDLLRLVWRKIYPYRLGFLLGLVSVSSTLILVFTGQRSEKLQFETKKEKDQIDFSSGQVLNQASSSAPAAPTPTKTPRPQALVSPKVSKNQTNINTATINQLESLPYIGPVTAQRIIDFRQSRGPFKNIEALDQVKGIGPKTLEKLRPLITIDR